MRNVTPEEREEILFAFQVAAPRPTIEDVAAWIDRHPECADAIRGHAELLLEVARTADAAAEPSLELLERGRATARAVLADARTRRRDPAAPAPTFAELLAAAGTSVPKLARALDIGRAVLTDLVQGRMRPPVPMRLVRALADGLRTTADVVTAAAVRAAASPQVGHAKARRAGGATARSFEEIVRGDPTMSAARKAFWLGA